jgi:hypothetical protein
VLAVGLTNVEFNNEPVLQLYELAPLAVSVAVCPEQIVGLFTLTVGVGITLTVQTAVFVQPIEFIPVTV